MLNLIRSLKSFDAYVKGATSKALRKPLKFYNENLSQLERDFKLTTIDNIEIFQDILAILNSLCVSKEKGKKYFAAKLSVYQLLQELSKEGYIQANYFLEVIDRKTRISFITLLTAGLVSAGTIAGLLSTPIFSGVLLAITQFLESPIGIPILSILLTASKAAYNTYYIITDRTQTASNQIRDVTFTLIKSSVLLIAYGLVIASSVAITPIVASIVIASLLVFGSVVDSCRELFCLVQELVKQQQPSPEGESFLNNKRSELRSEMAYKGHRNAAIINFVSALAFTAVTAISCFVPGGFLATLGAIAVFSLIYGIQQMSLKSNDRIIRDGLQENLSKLNNCKSSTNDLEMIESHTLSSNPVNSLETPSTFVNETSVSRVVKARGDGCLSVPGFSFFPLLKAHNKVQTVPEKTDTVDDSPGCCF